MTRHTSRRLFRDYRKRVNNGHASPQRNTIPRESPQQKSYAPRSFSALFVEFLRLAKGQRMAIAIALMLLSVATLLKLIPPAAVKLLIDYILPNVPLPAALTSILPLPADRVTLLCAIAAVVTLVHIVTVGIKLQARWMTRKAASRMQVAISKRVFEHIIRLPLHRVHQLKSGGATSLLRNDAGEIPELAFTMLYNPWQSVIQLAGSLMLLLWVDWRMMFCGAILIPIVYITHRTWIHQIRPLHKDIRSQRQQIDGYVTEAFGGMRVVRAFGRERSEANRFVRSSDLMMRKSLFVWWWSRIIDSAWNLLIPIASTALLVYGGFRIIQGQMTLGDLMMFLFYLGMFLVPLAVLVSSAASFQASLAGLDRVLNLLEEPSEVETSPDAILVHREKVTGRVSFRDVTFQYPASERPVLRDINLDVEPGATIALIGRSGAGKTTLCNLVARFYDPTSGTIELDGVDLRELQRDSYHGILGIVDQDVFLFDGTIAENIGYAVRRPTPSAIEQASIAANAHEFILSLEHGYETIVGERGVKLSGGQRQRLAIARALLADPKILILDEATSNLDTKSERLIQQSLKVLERDRTCFIIAHRLSTIQHADRIVVLSDGEIVEVGTHDELIARSGQYQRMIELQASVDLVLQRS